MSYKKSEEGKLIDEIIYKPIKIEYTKNKIKADLEASKARRDIKQMELNGANDEVAKFEVMLAEAEKLEIIDEEPNTASTI